MSTMRTRVVEPWLQRPAFDDDLTMEQMAFAAYVHLEHCEDELGELWELLRLAAPKLEKRLRDRIERTRPEREADSPKLPIGRVDLLIAMFDHFKQEATESASTPDDDGESA
jgi:hypothetical protein